MSSNKSVNRVARSSERRRLQNRSVRSGVRTYIARAEKFGNAGELKSAQEAVAMAISNIDKAVKKGVIHSNKGARLKSQLMRRLNALPQKGSS